MKISFVVQGPYIVDMRGFSTNKLFNTLNNLFPDSEIIFSTWPQPLDVIPYVKYIYSPDPGPIDWAPVYLSNFKRLVVSSYEGVNISTGDIVIKLRSDSNFNPAFKSRLLELLEKYKSDKLLIPMHTTPRHAYMLEDKIIIGTKAKQLIFWGIKDLDVLVETARRPLPSAILDQVYTTYQKILAPEQLLFIRYCGIDLMQLSSQIYCYQSFINSIRNDFTLINAYGVGFLSAKWNYKSTIKFKFYLYSVQKFPIRAYSCFLAISNVFRLKFKAISNRKYRR
jgi:hypothetical protein